jgi:hypothetical protein
MLKPSTAILSSTTVVRVSFSLKQLCATALVPLVPFLAGQSTVGPCYLTVSFDGFSCSSNTNFATTFGAKVVSFLVRCAADGQHTFRLLSLSVYLCSPSVLESLQLNSGNLVTYNRFRNPSSEG